MNLRLLNVIRLLLSAGVGTSLAATVRNATATVKAATATITAETTARTGGVATALEATCVGLAGDTSGASYVALSVDVTKNGGSAVATALKVGDGFDAVLDVSACETGEADVVIGDNLAVALQVRESTNAYLTVRTTNNSEALLLGKLTLFSFQQIDMADAAVQLVLGTAGAGEVKLTGQVLAIDPNSGGASEDLTLPTATTLAGLMVWIKNIGSQSIVVKYSGSTIATITAGSGAAFGCSGAAWVALV